MTDLRSTNPYGLLIDEFLELDPNSVTDILNYWNDYRLPHPGCPISFQLVILTTYLIHGRKPTSTKQLISAGLQFRGHINIKISATSVTTYDCPVVQLYFPYKGRIVNVPLDMAGRYNVELLERIKLEC